jgi:PAS domain S-box-containing protein
LNGHDLFVCRQWLHRSQIGTKTIFYQSFSFYSGGIHGKKIALKDTQAQTGGDFMSTCRPKPGYSPWSNVQLLLTKGPEAIEGLGFNENTLMDIIHENDRLFHAMVDAFDGLIYICSIDYRIEYLNERMIDHLGQDETGEYCYRAFGRRSVCPWCFNHRILKGETVRWEMISPRDGRWYYVVNAPVRHIDGRVSKYAMMMDIHDRKLDEVELKKHRDHLEEMVRARTSELTAINQQLRSEIEDRKKVEKTLRESQQRYHSLFEGSRDAIIISDARGRILDVNDAASALTGYNKSELIHKLVQDLDDSIDFTAYQDYFNRITAGASFSNEAVIQRKDGTRVFAEFGSKQVTLAGTACIHTTARDITARKQAEEALRRSEAKYRELVENANSIIIRFNTRGQLTFFNEYAQRFFGYSESEILGKSLTETILPAEGSTGRLSGASLRDFFIHPEKYKTNELENRRRDGGRVWVAWTNRPIKGPDGRIIEFLCVGVDITERKQAREQIQSLTRELLKAQESERYKIARDLHDHIAQDLTSLKIGLQTLFEDQLREHYGSHKQINGLIQVLQRSISEVRNMAYDLRPPGLDQLGLVRTLYVYCEDFAQTSNFKVDFVSAGLDGMALDKETQINIYRLIQESLHNVKKHAQAKGVTIRLVASSPNLMLRIIDDGKGFDVARWRATPHTEKRMGLQSMMERVGLLGGTIDIRSRPQKGTAILITIPIQEYYRDGQDTNPDH